MELSGNIFTPFKGRKLDLTSLVWVYRNLHGKGYSIRQGGLVRAHTKQLMLNRVQFKVSEAGRQRVLKTGRRNVHAYAKGFVSVGGGMGTDAADKREKPLPAVISYNPFKGMTFFCANLTVRPVKITGADCVIFNDRGCFAAYTYP